MVVIRSPSPQLVPFKLHRFGQQRHFDRVYRHDKPPAGHLRYCCHAFSKPSVKEKIVEMAFNGPGIRHTARALNIGINTILRALKIRTKASNYRNSCVG
jgi:transposase-like protein